MRHLIFAVNIIAIFLISLSSLKLIAEPIGPDPKVNKPHAHVDEGPPQSTTPLKNLDVSVPSSENPSTVDTYFYSYQSSVSVNVGPYLMEDTAPNTIFYGLIGFNYLWYSPYLIHLESGIESISSGEGHFWTMVRFQSNGTSQWRPFYGVGMGVRIIPQNGLATFLQLADYFPRVSIGGEYGISNRRSLRMEAAGAIDFQGHPFITLTAGYSWGI